MFVSITLKPDEIPECITNPPIGYFFKEAFNYYIFNFIFKKIPMLHLDLILYCIHM
jgi:hypothetical protein